MKTVWMSLAIVGLITMVGCGPKAVYIQGGQGSSASLDVSAATGSGRIVITGPYVYCEERIVSKTATEQPTGQLCQPLQPAKTP